MKTNEAPRKIYLQPLENNEIYNHWYTLKLNNDFIEYTQTDAFIEKACGWLYLQLNEINMEEEDMENFLKDFRKYMKGE